MTDAIWLWWSSGKDSAWALHEMRSAGETISALVVTIDAATQRVGLHGTPRELLDAQARSVGLDLQVVELPWPTPNDAYERAVAGLLERARGAGVRRMAFGDLHLADVRAYRERLLSGSGIEPYFPLWGRPSESLAEAMLDAGLDALVTCVEAGVLPAAAVGRRWDRRFLAELPTGADPCGENGELHTFVRWAPGFASRVEAVVDEPTEHSGFFLGAPRPDRRLSGCRRSGSR